MFDFSVLKNEKTVVGGTAVAKRRRRVRRGAAWVPKGKARAAMCSCFGWEWQLVSAMAKNNVEWS